MERLALPEPLRARVDGWRRQGLRIGLVPTMGNLHAGHLALVAQAQARCQRVVATVFVNPTQFGPGEDFDRYPRTLEDDAQALARQGCDLLYAPAVPAIYPDGPGQAFRVTVPALAGVLCGAHRPGHFDGVATVVTRLYNQVRPDLAVFGEKDFQQLRILERLTHDLGYGIEVVRGATVRESDGLALSSRNRYLDADARARRPCGRRSCGCARTGAPVPRCPRSRRRRARNWRRPAWPSTTWRCGARTTWNVPGRTAPAPCGRSPRSAWGPPG